MGLFTVGHSTRSLDELVDLLRIGEFFFDGHRRRWLQVLAEARSGVGKTPGGQLDAKRIQRVRDAIGLPCVHQTAPG